MPPQDLTSKVTALQTKASGVDPFASFTTRMQSAVPDAMPSPSGSLISKIQGLASSAGNAALDAISSHVSAKNEPVPVKPVAKSEAYPVIFGEISNRPPEKKELEARVILTTAVNRMREYAKRGINKTLDEVLAMPNQYQAFGGDQYKLYKQGTSTVPDKKKQSEVDTIVANLLKEIDSGTFKPLSASAYYYKHGKDGSIAYDDKTPLFK